MWSTAPRMVVEVRLACDIKPKSGTRESALVKRVCPEIASRDILVVDVAKANVPVLSPEPRYLIRRDGAVLEDVTEQVAQARKDNMTANERQAANDTRASLLTEEDREELRLGAVVEFIRRVVGVEPGLRVVRSRLDENLAKYQTEVKHLDQVTPTRGSDAKPRPKALNLYLNRLVECGALRRQGTMLFVADLSAAEVNAVTDAA